jgi:SAM-dependent methyltransferase
VSGSLPSSYFDELYADNPDPWGFETSPYEAEKYAATLTALPEPRYANALEIGCSIGVLTERLAARCDALLSVDVAEKALVVARERCRTLPHVQFARMRVPDEFPDERFDLILLSEVGYYWSREDLAKAGGLIVEHLRPAGQLLLVHWTPAVPDYPLTGDEVHQAFLELAGLRHIHGSRAEQYRLDLFERD